MADPGSCCCCCCCCFAILLSSTHNQNNMSAPPHWIHPPITRTLSFSITYQHVGPASTPMLSQSYPAAMSLACECMATTTGALVTCRDNGTKSQERLCALQQVRRNLWVTIAPHNLPDSGHAMSIVLLQSHGKFVLYGWVNSLYSQLQFLSQYLDHHQSIQNIKTIHGCCQYWGYYFENLYDITAIHY